jgi:hypothetical protein
MTPQEEKALLLRVATKLVAPQLKQGGFLPFGAILGQNRDVQLLMPKSVKRDVTRDELDKYWTQTIRDAIGSGEYLTVGWCADVREQTKEGGLIPAVFIHVEHVRLFSEDILIKYGKKESGEVVFGEPITEATQHLIFATSSGRSSDRQQSR